jgi:hypothetical protein
MTLGDLRARAGLRCTTVSLGRKLGGKQILTTEEAQELSAVLRVKLVWAPRRWAA